MKGAVVEGLQTWAAACPEVELFPLLCCVTRCVEAGLPFKDAASLKPPLPTLAFVQVLSTDATMVFQ